MTNVTDITQVVLADTDAQGSIVSSFNSPTTVFDVPFRAGQGEVYSRFLANPALELPKGQKVYLIMTPEPRPEGKPRRVVDFTLKLSPDTLPTLSEKLTSFRGVLPEQDPFVTLDFDGKLTLQQCATLAQALNLLDNDEALRIEAPLAGQLYYKAFLPSPHWRERANRPTQPCELHLKITAEETDGGRASPRAENDVAEVGEVENTPPRPPITASLTHIEEVWEEGSTSIRPKLISHIYTVGTPKALPGILKRTKVELPALLVFVPPTLLLEELNVYLDTVRDTHPLIYIFLEE